jgi:exopolysaccharide production protein ExoQ
MNHFPSPNQATEYDNTHPIESEFEYEEDIFFEHEEDFLPDLNLRDNWFTKLEHGFVIGVVIYHTNVLYLLLSGRLSAEDPMTNRLVELEGSPLLALTKGVVLITLFFLISQRWRSLFHVFQRRKGLLLFMGWIILSSFWAPQFDKSFKNANELGIVTLTGLYLGSRFSLREFLKLAAIGLGLVALGNFLYCLAVPSIGIQVGIQSGAWRGLFIQKNTLARVLFFSSLIFLSLLSEKDPMDRLRGRWIQAGLAICTLMTVLSQSKTGLVLLLGFMILVQIFKVLRSRHSIVFPMIFCVLLIASMATFVMVQNYEAVLVGLGRDVTLSGRTDIWGAIVDKIFHQPWIGYGYGGFWQGKEGESIDIWYIARDMPPHGHNGYLDMALDIGLVGLGLFVIDFLRTIARSIRCLRQMPMMESIFPILYLSGVFMYNITEDSLIGDSSFNFIWLIYCYVSSAMLLEKFAELPTELEFEESFQDA